MFGWASQPLLALTLGMLRLLASLYSSLRFQIFTVHSSHSFEGFGCYVSFFISTSDKARIQAL